MKKLKTEDFQRIKVEETKIINTDTIKNLDDILSDENLQNLSLEELQYMIEYEDHSKSEIEKIKKYIKLKKKA